MKKVGIVTITGEANYGNSLQNYAVEQVLKDLGLEAKTIRYPYKDKLSVKNNLKKAVKAVIGKGDSKQMKRRACFNDFNNKYLNFVDIGETNNFDYFVCGSDQIWNPKIFQVGRHLGYYFADFAPKEKRVAYSASIGIDFFPDEYVPQFEKLLGEMRSISVRETKAAEMIEELTGRKSTVTVDPTLMLSRSQWLEIAKKPSYINDGEKYILAYFLGDVSQDISAFVKKVCDTYGCKVIFLETEWKNDDVVKNEQWFCTRPDELIWLINNCSLLVTDSYHGSVFSIMLEKPFRCFSRAGGTSAGSRMDTLFEKFKVSGWCVGDLNEDMDNLFKTDFPCSEEVFRQERKVAIDYLKEALNI